MPFTAPNADIEVGLYSLADMHSADTAARRIRDIVDYGVAADQLGLDVFGVGEHHTSRFVVSSPAVVLAAIAARTSSITLASTVSVLSVLDPVRLYQDFAQLDLVSGGRAEITVGRGAYAEPFDIFGVDDTQYDEVFAEKLDLLRRLTTDEVITWEGRFRSPLDRATVTPRLGRTLPVRVGVGGSSASAGRAGRAGLPMTLAHLGGSAARAEPAVDLYWSSAEAAGHPISSLGVGLASHLYVGGTSQGARETFTRITARISQRAAAPILTVRHSTRWPAQAGRCWSAAQGRSRKSLPRNISCSARVASSD